MLPKELQNILNEAKKSIIDHPKGELILSIRKKIWKAFGPYKESEYIGVSTTGLKRRVKLASLCVEKVIDKWNKVVEDDERPLEMLEIAQGYIEGTIKDPYSGMYTNDFLNDVLSFGENYSSITTIGLAAISVVSIASCACNQTFVLLEDEEQIELDDDLDPESNEAAYDVSIAYADGAPWDKNSSIEKRREFWLWYITDAVPQAYLAYTDKKTTKEQIIDELHSLDKFNDSIKMGLPKELQESLKEARKAIIEHPKGELILPVRKKIWKTFGEIKMISNSDNIAIPIIGLKRRVELRRLCVEKVIGIWNEVMENDNRPLEMIETAQKYINGNIDSKSAIKQYKKCLRYLEKLDFKRTYEQNLTSKYFDAVMVGIAAVHIVDMAISDEVLMFKKYDKKLDSCFAISSSETSYSASLAYVGGRMKNFSNESVYFIGKENDEEANIKKRQEFWLWYLTEAVPKAYLAYPDDLYLNKGRIVCLSTYEKDAAIANPTKEQVINKLDSINKFNSCVLLENYNENGVESFIKVENDFGDIDIDVRRYSSDGSFTQWTPDYYEDDELYEDENLSIEMIKRLFESFMDGCLLCKDVEWFDVTENCIEDY